MNYDLQSHAPQIVTRDKADREHQQATSTRYVLYSAQLHHDEPVRHKHQGIRIGHTSDTGLFHPRNSHHSAWHSYLLSAASKTVVRSFRGS